MNRSWPGCDARNPLHPGASPAASPAGGPVTGPRAWIPNALSVLRIILAPAMFAVPDQPVPLFALIAACGLSDVLDGLLARRWRVRSRLGARLDSLGDLVFFGALAAWFLVWRFDLVRETWPWLAAVAGTRLAALALGRARNKRWYSIHTIANKAAGLAIFAAVCVHVLTGNRPVVFAVLLLALASALEELLIFALVKNPDPDRLGLLVRRGDRRESPGGEPTLPGEISNKRSGA
jgi:CDP-diacylglycerol--glycerol-3-phosphate 3-phosphatidyltransferase